MLVFSDTFNIQDEIDKVSSVYLNQSVLNSAVNSSPICGKRTVSIINCYEIYKDHNISVELIVSTGYDI